MIGRFGHEDSDRDRERARDEEAAEEREFELGRKHERRILSWSPDPVEELADEPEEPYEEPVTAEPAPKLAPPPKEPAPEPPVPTPERRETAERSAPTSTEPRRRGRPRGRPRRQVHFHVDPDEELLLLEAAKKHGSQQKGLIAALQALQDNDVLRTEIDRLRTECERQRALLANAEAIFKR